MKTLKIAFFVLTILSSTFAQEKKFERKGGFGGKPPHREMQHLRFAKYILSEKYIAEAEITPEQVKRLKNEFEMLDKKMSKTGKKIGDLAKNQAEISVKVLTTPGADGREMMKLIDNIGELRIQQAKLSVQVLMAIRDNLNPEQCAKVVELMKGEREKMRTRQKFMRERMQNRRTNSAENQFKPEKAAPSSEL